jgi:hypothetical protein
VNSGNFRSCKCHPLQDLYDDDGDVLRMMRKKKTKNWNPFHRYPGCASLNFYDAF